MDVALSAETKCFIAIIWALGGALVMMALSLWGLSAMLYPARTQAQALSAIQRISHSMVWEQYDGSEVALWLTRLRGVLASGASLALCSNFVEPVY